MLNEYNRLKRIILDHEFSHLNNSQKEAVFHTKGSILILAGAGSGKTTTIVNRIAFLIKYGHAYEDVVELPYGVDQSVIDHMLYLSKTGEAPDEALRRIISVNPVSPYSILAFTFTNKAAGEMRERIERMLGVASSGMWMGTFHSICVKILRYNIDYLGGYSSNFVIYDTDDQKTLMKECIARQGLNDKDFPPRSVLEIIGRAKDKMITPKEFALNNADSYKMGIYAKLYEMYQNRLVENNAFDFDDIIINTIHLLQDNEKIADYYSSKFEYVMVDEYQDTNKAQYTLISLLSKKYKNLCVVGDDDQSIYGWRGADITNIIDFEHHYINCMVVKLEQNYRSTKLILNAANALIQNNLNRKLKELWTRNNEGEKIKLYSALDERDEARFVAQSILNEVTKENYKFSDCCVLYRTHVQSRVLEDSLIREGIAYKIIGGLRFYERREIKDVLAYLKVVLNNSDTVGLKRIINMPKRGIGDSAIQKVEQISLETGKSMLEIIKNVTDYEELSIYSGKFTQFTNLIDEFTQQSQAQSASSVIEAVISKTNIIDEYKKEGEIEAKTRIENMQELIGIAMELEKQQEETLYLQDFLAYTSLISDMDNLNEEVDSVTLMSMHSAKGLEYPIVFIVGMEDGLFPKVDEYKQDSKELEEERRLCYVSITRAKEKLYMLHASCRMIYGRTDMYRKVSRFINEIPVGLIEDKQSKFAKKFAPEYVKKQKKQAYIKSDVGSTYKKKEETFEDNVDSEGGFDIGCLVTHAKFGKGTIFRIQTTAGMTVLTIDFDTCGRKTIIASAVKRI